MSTKKVKRKPRSDTGQARAPYRESWSVEAKERHARLYDALRFRRLTRTQVGELGQFDHTRTLNLWIERGDPGPNVRGSGTGAVLTTERLAGVLRVASEYLQIGGPSLWSTPTSSQFVSAPGA